MVDAKEVWFRNDILHGYLYQPENYTNAVVICHGFPGHSSRLFIPALAEELGSRYLTLRFDFSGNGKSKGSFYETCISKDVDDLGSAVSYISGLGTERICLIGHSTGGTVATLYAQEHTKVRGLITIAIQSDLIKAMHEDFNEDQLKELRNNGKTRIPNPSIGDELDWVSKTFIDDQMLYRPLSVAEDIELPTLIIYGSSDSVADSSHSKRFFDAIPRTTQKEIYPIKGADHAFSNPEYEGALIKKCREWLRSWEKIAVL